jgi:hypothetical protein
MTDISVGEPWMWAAFIGFVIGSTGLGATEALLLGSVAHQVIHLSKASVLVVR